MRDINLGATTRARRSRSPVGMSGEAMYEMFRLLAIAKYAERYVIPTAHAEQAHALEELATDRPVSQFGGGEQGSLARGPDGAITPVAVENFRAQGGAERDSLSELAAENFCGRVNLLNWDGMGPPEGIFPGDRKE